MRVEVGSERERSQHRQLDAIEGWRAAELGQSKTPVSSVAKEESAGHLVY